MHLGSADSLQPQERLLASNRGLMPSAKQTAANRMNSQKATGARPLRASPRPSHPATTPRSTASSPLPGSCSTNLPKISPPPPLRTSCGPSIPVARGHALRTPQPAAGPAADPSESLQPQQSKTSSAKLASFRQNPKTPLRAAPNLLLSTRMPRRLPARPPPQPPRSPAGMDAAPGDFQTLLTRPCSPRSPCIKPYPSFGSVCSEQAGRYNL
jgi:hypothetical protein